MISTAYYTIKAPEHLHAWLQPHHGSETELWVAGVTSWVMSKPLPGAGSARP